MFRRQGNLGVLLYLQGKVAQAIPHLRAAIERQPGLDKIQGLLGLAEALTSGLRAWTKGSRIAFPMISELKFKIEVGLELVSVDAQSGDLERAGAVIAQLRKAAPDNSEVFYAAYGTYSDLSGESMLALSLAAPDSAAMHELMAHEATRQGNSNAAVAEHRRPIANQFTSSGVHFELGASAFLARRLHIIAWGL